MKISNRQKRALEKISGKPWNVWRPEAVEAYFSYTDRGEETPLFSKVWRLQLPGSEFNEVEQALWDLMRCHVFHAVTVEMWKEDFQRGLLFLSDFKDYPQEYIRHAFDIYEKATGGPAPSCFWHILK